jgi:hypothetical protein
VLASAAALTQENSTSPAQAFSANQRGESVSGTFTYAVG